MIKFPHTLGTSSAINTIGNGTEHLYLAGLSENNTSEASCSGALIAPTWLLTLAECAPMAKWATIGSKCASGEDDSELIEVVRQVLDPDYTVSVTPYHELAMLELKTPSKYTPVNISWDSYLDTSTLWVRGFDTSTMNKTLVETTAKLWGFDECDKFYSGHPGYERTLHGSMQCLREIQCQQNRGSAVMVDVNGTSQLIGLTYWQSQNNSIAPAVYILVTAGEAFIQSPLSSCVDYSSLRLWSNLNSTAYGPIEFAHHHLPFNVSTCSLLD
ncbi:hypothetical protein DYB37_011302 [Aphanomyces astaci]|uniref:Peptidase S1 domain-containing protein n=1 Tax=Aphanomyces astaci TaxID=112090 RepID=A0A418FGY3_APHAT|nr:hypothetical protein DYB37_011302 [Aphanomyces astaci]